MSLYLKYRPKTIEELDLLSVRQALTEMVRADKMAHAYLLTGPRGAGKTSAARIMARIANCQDKKSKRGVPCGECEACRSILGGRAVDVIEMDAASSRGIDDIRELREKIRLAPSVLLTKVYIIDEVHMLTTEAFNALLKTLEEPPAHSLFILATTEAHKVPATIVSRCVQLKFGKASPPEMKRSLTRVVVGEGAEIEAEALEELASAVDGSFRDGVKILEQALLGGGKVTLEQMQAILTGAKGWDAEPLIKALLTREMTGALTQLHKVTDAGVELGYLTTELMRQLGRLVRDGELQLVPLIYKLDEVARRLATSPVPELLLEMAVIEWCTNEQSPKKGPSAPPPQTSEPKKKPKVTAQNKENESLKAESAGFWSDLVSGLGQESVGMGTLLAKVSVATIKGDELVLGVRYEFHREQLMQPKMRQRIEQVAGEATGRPVRMICQVRDGDRPLNSPVKVDSIAEESLSFEETQAIFSKVNNN